MCILSNYCLQVALSACKEAAGDVKEIAFILSSQQTFAAWKKAADEFLPPLNQGPTRGVAGVNDSAATVDALG